MEEDLLSKKGIKQDLRLIKSCLVLINISIKASDEDFTDKETFELVSGIENMLNRIKKNIKDGAE